MDLVLSVCRSARATRDSRFDGRFFIAGKTTGIYCRPVCPATSPREENVSYYPTAAAAASAGYRPCLRCRPETAPGTAAWLGTQPTVARALRLIEEGALEEANLDTLAARLGVGPRHLHRLFVKHLGASPVVYAQTRRLQFAKRLIDETSLPATQIALASGFGSVRRFNDVMKRFYHRSPTELRQLVRKPAARTDGAYDLRLRFRPPYDWESMLRFLSARAIPGVEVVENGEYRRTLERDGKQGWMRVRMEAGALRATIAIGNPLELLPICSQLRRMFDLEADSAAIEEQLRQSPLLRCLVDAHPGLRIPGAWDGWETAVRAVLGQQVSVAAATTFARRMVERFGEPAAVDERLTHLFPTPERIAEGDMTGIGLTGARVETLRALARGVVDGSVQLRRITGPETLAAQLESLRGIGPWTAQYIVMRVANDPDALPAEDLILRRAAGAANAKQMRVAAEAWRPWRAYATLYLWTHGGAK